jgi:hypothetical protein
VESSRLRLALNAALRRSIGIFLTTVFLIPALSLINRIFDATWHVNWRLMLWVSSILTGCFFSFFFITDLLEFSAEASRERNRQSIFPAVMWLRGVYLVCIAMGFTTMVGVYREGDPWWDVVLPFAFVLLGFFAWPRAIQITEVDIRQRRLLLGTKRIAFGEIEGMVFDVTRGEVVVFDKNGVRVVHTLMHVEKVRFIERVESMTGKEVALLGAKS